RGCHMPNRVHRTPVASSFKDKLAPTLRVLRHNGPGLVGGLLVLLVVGSALLAPILTPHDPTTQDLRQRLQPPAWAEGGTWDHPLGTDQLGRDLLARVLFGGRVSVLIGVSAVFVAGSVGLLLGLVAGYFGGRIDSIIM